MRQLREYGVYRLPDRESYVAVRGGSGRFYLFECKWGLDLPPAFVVEGGRVRRWFTSGTEWSEDDLEDTGETFDRTHKFKCPS